MPKGYKNSSSGFTLIELLVVILVVGALSGVLLGVVNNSGVRAKARDNQRKADLNKIQIALETYFADNRHYPVQASWGLVNGTSSSPLNLLEDEGYIDPVPTDPSGTGTDTNPCADSESYRYLYTSDGETYTLTAMMEVETSAETSPCVGSVCIDSEDARHCYFVRSP